jgi:MFS family permease
MIPILTDRRQAIQVLSIPGSAGSWYQNRIPGIVAVMTQTTVSNAHPAPVLPGSSRARPGLVLAIVLTGQFMALLDASIVNVAIPAIHLSLGASGASLQLVVAGYTIAYAVLLVTGARLGDAAGHRRMFLGGLAVFTLASLGCGLAPSAGWLIALRFVQGAGAAAMIPQVLSLIQRSYTGPARAGAMSVYSAVLAGGAAAGQVAGGLLISANLFGGGWRPVFLVNVPIGAVLLAAGARLLPPGGGTARGIDALGLATLSPAVLAFVVPLVLGQPEHWPVWGFVLLALSAVGLAAFAAVERRAARRGGSPIVPGRVLRLPGMPLGLAGLFVMMTVFGGFFFSFALHLQGGLGDSALRAGLTFAPSAVAFALVSLNWRRLPERAHDPLVIVGFAAAAGGLTWLAVLLHTGTRGGAAIYLAGIVFGAGMAAAYSPLMTRMLLRVPVADAADVTGVIVTVVQLALVAGVATFGTLYLNLAGRLPVVPGAAAFRLASAHAESVTFLALAGAAVLGGGVAALRSALLARRSAVAAAGRPGRADRPVAVRD